MNFRVIGAMALLFAAPSTASALDLLSCSDDLDSLSQSAHSASYPAEAAKRAEDDLNNCKRSPDIFDLMHDHCRLKASEYQSALVSLQIELGRLVDKIQSAASSCGTSSQHTPGLGNPRSDLGPICEVFRGYRDQLPAQALLATCEKSLSAAICKKCLSPPR